jgi:uncharacterized membrane protein YkoI
MMRTPFYFRVGAAALVLAGAALLAACSSTHSGKMPREQAVTLDQVSAPAQATITREVGNGHVDKITREVERGKTVYDVEATAEGRHMEYLISDADGQLLGTEVPIEFNQLPELVRAAAEKYFGTSNGLTVMKGVEYGETQYEIEGRKNGKKVEVSFDPEGKPAK